MPRNQEFTVPTRPVRVPEYAISQVKHLSRLLDVGGNVVAEAAIPTEQGMKWMRILYSQQGVDVIEEALIAEKPIPYEGGEEGWGFIGLKQTIDAAAQSVQSAQNPQQRKSEQSEQIVQAVAVAVAEATEAACHLRMPIVIEIEDGDSDEDGDEDGGGEAQIEVEANLIVIIQDPVQADLVNWWLNAAAEPDGLKEEDCALLLEDNDASPESSAGDAQIELAAESLLEGEEVVEADEAAEPTPAEVSALVVSSTEPDQDGMKGSSQPEWRMELSLDLENADQAIVPVSRQELQQFALSVFQTWQQISHEVWGQPVSIAAIYDQGFRSMLVLSFLAQLGAVVEQNIETASGRIILTQREKDGDLLRVGQGNANGITFTKILKLKRHATPTPQWDVPETVNVSAITAVTAQEAVTVATAEPAEPPFVPVDSTHSTQLEAIAEPTAIVTTSIPESTQTVPDFLRQLRQRCPKP